VHVVAPHGKFLEFLEDGHLPPSPLRVPWFPRGSTAVAGFLALEDPAAAQSRRPQRLNSGRLGASGMLRSRKYPIPMHLVDISPGGPRLRHPECLVSHRTHIFRMDKALAVP